MKTFVQVTIQLCAAAFIVTGCSTNPHKAVKIDTVVGIAASSGNNQIVGVKGGDMIVQRKVLMSEELRALQNEAYNLEAKVYGGSRYLDNKGVPLFC